MGSYNKESAGLLNGCRGLPQVSSDEKFSVRIRLSQSCPVNFHLLASVKLESLEYEGDGRNRVDT